MPDGPQARASDPAGWWRAPWEILTALFVAALLLVVLVVLPLGLWAVSTLDQAGPWRAALGEATPLRYRLFVFVQAVLLRSVVFWAGAVVVHGLLRRRLRRTTAFGDDLLWDAVYSPLVTGGGVAVILLVALVAARGLGSSRLGAREVLALTSLLVVGLGVVGLVLGLLRRSRGLRLAVAAVVAVLALAPLVRVAADAWAARRLRAFARSAEQELAGEARRMAAVRLPVLRDPALEEDAYPRYRALWSELAEADRPPHPCLEYVPGGAPLEEECRRLLERRREVVRGLREAVHCDRCVFEVRLLRPMDAAPSLLPARTLASLLILEGHERAEMGDPRGAAERYLDAVRFGCDLRGGALLENLVGIAIAGSGLEALGHLVVSDPGPPLPQVGAELAKLDGHLPTTASALRLERARTMGGLGLVETADDVFGVPAVLPLIVPYRFLAAHAAAAYDQAWEAARGEEVGARPDPAGAEVGPRWNPAFRLVAPAGLPRVGVSVNLLAARFALVQAAVQIEEAASGGRSYPADASSLSLPGDPMAAGSSLRYEPSPDRRGYRLWSVGYDGRDDGGISEQERDLVLERASTAQG
jgi:hypothetical protein